MRLDFRLLKICFQDVKTNSFINFKYGYYMTMVQKLKFDEVKLCRDCLIGVQRKLFIFSSRRASAPWNCTWGTRRRSSSRLRYRIHHNNSARRRLWPTGASRKIRNHLRPPDARGRRDPNHACEEMIAPHRDRKWKRHHGRSPPSQWFPSLDPTRGDHTTNRHQGRQ